MALDFLSKGRSQIENVPLYNPQQQAAFSQLLQKGLSGLGQNQPSFEPIRQQALRTYQQDIVPTLAERFAGMGTGGNLRSSGFREALGRSGQDLVSDLAAQEQQFGMGQQDFLARLLQTGLTRQFDPVYTPGGPGGGASLAGGLGQGLGAIGSGLALSKLLGSGSAAGAAGTAAAEGAAGGGLGFLGSGGLAALAAQPWFWPALAALAAGAGGYGAYKLFNMD